MKVFVISLPDAEARRVSAARQLAEAGLDFDFFDAFAGAAAWRCFYGYDPGEYLVHTGRLVVPGEVGCYASHLALWERCVELDEPIVVLEDDFRAHRHFAEALQQLATVIGRYGFVRLEATPDEALVRVQRHGRFELFRCQKYPHCATGYVLTPQVAAAFVAGSRTLRSPVDKFIKKFWEHGQPLYALAPAAVGLTPRLAADSGIGGRHGTLFSPLLKVRRMARKTSWSLRRARFNARMPEAVDGH